MIPAKVICELVTTLLTTQADPTMLLFITLLAVSCSLSLAAPGPCPPIKLANVTDPAKLTGTWYEPWSSWPKDEPVVFKCITVSWSGWNPTTGTMKTANNFAFLNNTKFTVDATVTKQGNNAIWEVVRGEKKSTAYILDYVEDKSVIFYTCEEQNAGKNHTESAYVFTRDLKHYVSSWWRFFVTALANKLQYLNMVVISYDDCPK